MVGACNNTDDNATTNASASSTDDSDSDTDDSDTIDPSADSSGTDPDTTTGPAESSGPGESSGEPAESSGNPEESSSGEPAESSGTPEESSSTDPAESSGNNTTGVVAACGNDVVEDAEVCDGADLGGADCISQGFAGGTLGCARDCSGYDTSACVEGGCAHDLCAQGEVLAPGCDDCVDQICAVDGYCCETAWDGQCVDEVGTICGTPCPGCGNDVIEDAEVCDGTDLALEDCVSQGFVDGTLGCADDCSAFDASNCTDGGSNCCEAHPGAGCSDAECQAAICAFDAFCCNNSWDGQCADEAAAEPTCAEACGLPVCGDGVIEGNEACDGGDLAGQTCVSQGFAAGDLSCADDCTFDTSECTNGGGSNCCEAHGGLGCTDPVCEASVCALDEYCCDTAWDGICVDEAEADPNCDAACSGGGGLACQDQDIGSTVGANVASGNTSADDDDLAPSCGSASANDHVMSFTAGAAGNYTFDTIGSGYDTKLAIYSDCSTQLACNDDIGGGVLQSSLTMNLAAGQTVLVVVDGYNGNVGNWVLNITAG